jgi:hypothetical protein
MSHQKLDPLDIPEILTIILKFSNSFEDVCSHMFVNRRWFCIVKRLIHFSPQYNLKRFSSRHPFKNIDSKKRQKGVNVMHNIYHIKTFPILPTGAIQGTCNKMNKGIIEEKFIFEEGKLIRHIKYFSPKKTGTTRVSYRANFSPTDWNIRAYLHDGNQAWIMTPTFFKQYFNDGGKKCIIYESGKEAYQKLRLFLIKDYFKNKVILYHNPLRN